jgi:hypothetical protein
MNTVDLDLIVKRVASQALRQRQYRAVALRRPA